MGLPPFRFSLLTLCSQDQGNGLFRTGRYTQAAAKTSFTQEDMSSTNHLACAEDTARNAQAAVVAAGILLDGDVVRVYHQVIPTELAKDLQPVTTTRAAAANCPNVLFWIVGSLVD
jgi:hypothetical protein